MGEAAREEQRQQANIRERERTKQVRNQNDKLYQVNGCVCKKAIFYRTPKYVYSFTVERGLHRAPWHHPHPGVRQAQQDSDPPTGSPLHKVQLIGFNMAYLLYLHIFIKLMVVSTHLIFSVLRIGSWSSNDYWLYWLTCFIWTVLSSVSSWWCQFIQHSLCFSQIPDRAEREERERGGWGLRAALRDQGPAQGQLQLLALRRRGQLPVRLRLRRHGGRQRRGPGAGKELNLTVKFEDHN